jgi:hypothetical protein
MPPSDDLDLDKRRSPRQPRAIPCELRIEGRQYVGIVKNVSSGGLSVQTSAEADPGIPVLVVIAPANDQLEVRVRGRVLRIDREGPEATMAIAVSDAGALARLLLGQSRSPR